MKPEIQKILVEANLTEAQIDQFTTAVGDSLAVVRTAHMEEVAAIEKSKDAVIGGLLRDLVEAKQALASALASTPPLVELAESLVLAEGLTARVTLGEFVMESVKDGVTHTVTLPVSAVAELAEAFATIELDEKIVIKPRRITSTNGNTAVGVDIDTTGTLAFTVTDENGSAVHELSRPDSIAIKSWFRDLEEAMKGKKKVNEDDEDDLEETIRAKVIAAADKLLTEALRPYAPLIRQAKDHARMKQLVEGLEEAFGNVFAAPQVADTTLTEATATAAIAASAVLEEANKNLASENLALRQSMLFNERTAGMAQTTRGRVEMIVEAARPANLQDYSDLLEVAIQSVKPSVDVTPTPPAEKNAVKTPSLMQSVIDKL